VSVAPCIECRQLIDEAAKKCIHCGSYQDWRRYLAPYNNAIAIGISIAALTATLGQLATNTWENGGAWIAGSLPALRTSISTIGVDEVQFSVENSGTEIAHVYGVSCAIYLAKNQADIARYRLEQWGKTGLKPSEFPAEYFFGPYYVNYELTEPVLVEGGNRVSLRAFFKSALSTSISPNFPVKDNSIGCFLGAFDENMQGVGSIGKLSLFALRNIAPDDLIVKSSFVGISDNDIAKLCSSIGLEKPTEVDK